MKVATVQISVTPGDVAANTAKMLSKAREAADAGASVIVFPEMTDTGYEMPVILKTAQFWNEGTVPALQECAKALNVHILAGVSERTNEGVYNSSVFIDGAGAIIGKYRKTHLITAEPMVEHKYLLQGDALGLIDAKHSKYGVMTCYEIRFPEIARTLSISGATILFIPSAWPLVRLPHWTTLLTARAIENQVFVVAANRIGVDAGIQFCGTSLIIDPYGTVLSSASCIHESIVTAEINYDMMSVIRSQIRIYEDRRVNLYKLM